MERVENLGDVPPLISLKKRPSKSQTKNVNATSPTSSNNSQNNRQTKKSPYKKASERPPVSVARRNARERGRVHVVNQMFGLLKNLLPSLKQKTKRVSKLKILKAAMDYMYDLQNVLDNNGVSAPHAVKSRGHTQRKIDHHRNHQKSTLKSTANANAAAASLDDVVPNFVGGILHHQAGHPNGQQQTQQLEDDGLIAYFRLGHMNGAGAVADAPMDPYNDYRLSEAFNNARLSLEPLKVAGCFDTTANPSIESPIDKYFLMKNATNFSAY
uniref:BHLH domain-containing protein n=1 Tax=Romanomermis culicivorax TaxID=13658 RepID=A0A915I7Q4_ROMCU